MITAKVCGKNKTKQNNLTGNYMNLILCLDIFHKSFSCLLKFHTRRNSVPDSSVCLKTCFWKFVLLLFKGDLGVSEIAHAAESIVAIIVCWLQLAAV